VLGISIFISVIYLFWSFKYGKPAPRNPWGASSLEWQAPTPPTLYNFEKPPVLHEIYNYDDLYEIEEDVWERRSPTEVEPSEAPGTAHEHAKVHAPVVAQATPAGGLKSSATPVPPTVPPDEEDKK